MPEGLNSNLNLNEGAAPRVRPGLGEWGPKDVPTTRAKRRMRWIALAAVVGILGVVAGYGYWVWTLVR